MRILDVSAGKRAVWFNKHRPMATYLDIRAEVEPDIVADSRNMPQFVDSTYDLAVFDPPHVNFSASAELSRTYGHHTTAEIRDIICPTGKELSRVLRPDGLLALKWNDHDQKLSRILDLLPDFEPLFGHKVAQRNLRVSQTYWVMLRNRKFDAN
jgi:hypothetical protein